MDGDTALPRWDCPMHHVKLLTRISLALGAPGEIESASERMRDALSAGPYPRITPRSKASLGRWKCSHLHGGRRCHNRAFRRHHRARARGTPWVDDVIGKI